MRHIFIFVIVAAALSSVIGQTNNRQSQSTTKAEQEVRKLEREWLDAYEQYNVEAMTAIVADDFTITFPNGVIQTKEQIIKSLKAPRSPSSPATKFYTEDVQSRVYGDTVILIGRVVSEWQRDGKTTRQLSRYTDTYVKRNGRWQVVASHLSEVPKQ
jgi:uncharacterized protein (TIGR02246 family)